MRCPIKACFFIIFAIAAPAVAASRIEIILTVGLAGIGLVLVLLCWYWLGRRRLISLAGWINTAMSIAILAIMPFIWYASVGGEAAAPRTYMPKAYLQTLIFGFIILDAIALRPAYPLIVALGSVANYIFLYFYASQDSRFIASDDYVQAILGPHLHLPSYFINSFAIVLLGGATAAIAYRARNITREAVAHQAASAQLSRYFSPGVADRLRAAGKDFFQVGGETRAVAVLFSDIRGFTAISESLSPAEVISFLSEYHDLMVEAIFAHNGTLDKFIGDAILATFGAPESGPDDPERALRAALAMNMALENWNKKRINSGLAPVAHGIGLHFGPAVVGNIGARNRLEYTVIGDTVNAASRIENSCKKLGHSLLLSSQLADQLPPDLQQRLIRVGKMLLRGKSTPLELFSMQALAKDGQSGKQDQDANVEN